MGTPHFDTINASSFPGVDPRSTGTEQLNGTLSSKYFEYSGSTMYVGEASDRLGRLLRLRYEGMEVPDEFIELLLNGAWNQNIYYSQRKRKHSPHPHYWIKSSTLK